MIHSGFVEEYLDDPDELADSEPDGQVVKQQAGSN
jgi:hypothetical protein